MNDTTSERPLSPPLSSADGSEVRPGDRPGWSAPVLTRLGVSRTEAGGIMFFDGVGLSSPPPIS